MTAIPYYLTRNAGNTIFSSLGYFSVMANTPLAVYIQAVGLSSSISIDPM